MIRLLLRSMNIATLVVVIALFIQTCFVLGTVKSIGVFFAEFKYSLGTTSTDIGISLGLFNAFTFGPGPLVAHLYRHAVCRRPLLITGAILAPLGLILSSMVTNNIQLAACLSLGGLGGNILSQCLVMCLDAHAQEHFHTLFGISKSGYAFGMLISPLLAAYLMDIYGWRGAILIMGAITCHLIPLAAMVDTKVHNSENLGTSMTSDSAKSHDPSKERSKGNRDGGNGSIQRCSSMTTRGQQKDRTVVLENGSLLPHITQQGNVESGMVQQDCSQMLRHLSSRHDNESTGNLTGEATLTEQQDKGDLCSESCSLMEIDHDRISPTHSRHQQHQHQLLDSDEDQKSADRPTTSKFSIRKLFTNSVYNQDKCLIMILISNSFVAMLHGGWHAFFIPHAISRGKSLFATLCLLYSTSIACFISRVFSGVLLNPKLITGYDLFLLLRVLNVASMLADIYFSNFSAMIVTSFVTSFAINEENMFMIFIAKERSPRCSFPLVFAVIQIAFGIGALVGTYLTGMLADILGSYSASFFFLVSIEGVIFFTMLPPRFIKSKFQKE